MAVDSPGLILDMSDVDFMAVSTLGVIVRAREFLHQQSRSLTVQRPSRVARRVIGACGLDDLLSPDPQTDTHETADALGSWVAVAATERAGEEAVASPPVAAPVPAPVGRTMDLRAGAVSADGPAAGG
jgi:hypothetical protein